MCERLVTMVDKGLRRYPDAAAFKAMQSKYLRPVNIPHLQVPKVHDTIHQDLSFKATELAIKKVQSVSVFGFISNHGNSLHHHPDLIITDTLDYAWYVN
jgi:hypothetical protein